MVSVSLGGLFAHDGIHVLNFGALGLAAVPCPGLHPVTPKFLRVVGYGDDSVYRPDPQVLGVGFRCYEASRFTLVRCLVQMYYRSVKVVHVL